MPKIFALAPPPESYEIDTINTTAIMKERPLQHEEDEERGPTIASPILEATTSYLTAADMISMSATSIQAIVQRLAHVEAQLTQLIQ